jgi:hypothetical protein
MEHLRTRGCEEPVFWIVFLDERGMIRLIRKDSNHTTGRTIKLIHIRNDLGGYTWTTLV